MNEIRLGSKTIKEGQARDRTHAHHSLSTLPCTADRPCKDDVYMFPKKLAYKVDISLSLSLSLSHTHTHTHTRTHRGGGWAYS